MKLKYQKWVMSKIGPLVNKRYLVTGANSGIGFYACMYLAFLGADIIMACRNQARANKARDEIIAKFPNAKIDIVLYDQASLAKIDEAALEIAKRFSSLDGVVLNAGIFHPKRGEKTADGYNLTIGTNYLGTCYFVEKIKECYQTSPEMRLVFMTSLVYKTRKKAATEILTSGYKRSFSDYVVSKKMVTSYAHHLSLHESNFTVELVHPGVSSTNIYSSTNSHFPKWFMNLAHKILPIFTANPQKAALGILLGLKANRKEELGIYGPRGIFEIAGYPKYRKIKKSIIKESEQIMEITHNFLKSKKVEKC